MERYKVWDGRLKEAYRKRDIKKGTVITGPEYMYYRHYWRVVPAEGEEIHVEVPYAIWGRGRQGQRIEKKYGERHPTLLEMTDEDRKAAVELGWAEEKTDEASVAEVSIEEGKAFLEENAKADGVVVLDSGLQYKVINEGSGESPKATDRVRVHYTGKKINGFVFDSSYKRNAPAEFAVNGVIKGWTEALLLMKPGAKWELAIPSELAYGEPGKGPIGPNQVLLFEVELIEVLPQ
ncbi:MAG: hypothetical protein GWP08_02445 [Nitrospiraceae bacterium]|nr:hypothetical protein [Nitrospiraceae bacterium]